MKNKKTNKKIIEGLSITCLSALLMLSGCKIKTPSSSSSSSKEETTSSNQSSPSSSVQLKDFDDSIKFNDLTITYDGNEHQLEISNSSSVQIEYLTEYKFTNAGEYEIKARISKEGYNPKEITGKLIINKANEDISGISFNDVNETYNKEAHFATIDGTLPTGVTTQIKYYSDEACTREVNTCINAGTYYAKATFTARDNNHNTISPMTCKITISKAKVDVPVLKDTYFYTGSEIVVLESSELFNVADGSSTSVGNYEATVVLKDTKNYEWKDSNFNGKLTYSITDPLSDVQYDGLESTYDGTPKEILVSNLPENVTASIEYYNDEEYKNKISAPTNAGKYYAIIKFSGSSLNNETLIRKQTLTIKKQKVNLPTANQNLEYDGTPLVGVSPNELYDVENGTSTNVGTFTATVTLKDTTNYEWADSTFDGKIEYEICPPQGINMTNKVVTFNNTVQGLDIYGIDNLDVEYSIKYYSDDTYTNEVSPVNAGKYYAVATPNKETYERLTAVLTINKAKLGLSVSSTSVQYNGEKQKPQCSISSGKIDDTDVSVALSDISAIDAGNYDFGVSLLGEDKDNYYLDEKDLSITFVITKAKVDIPVLNECLYYSGKIVVAINPNPLYSINFGSAIDVGNYTATVTLKDTKNYEWKNLEFDGNIAYSITNPFLDIAYNNIEYIYSGTLDDFDTQLNEQELDGTDIQIKFYSDEALQNEIAKYDTTKVGKYYYVVNYVNSVTKEIIKTYEAKTLTVNKKSITVSWSNNSVAYDGKEHFPAFKIDGIIQGDEVIGSYVEEGKKAIGEYTFNLRLSGNDVANYSFDENLQTTLSIVVPSKVEKITSIDSVVSGTYALGAQYTSGEIFFVTTDISNTSTIKLTSCNSTNDMSSYTIPSSDIWTIEMKDANKKEFVIKVGNKYLSSSSIKGKETSLQLADEEYVWTLTCSEDNPSILYFKNGSRALLMQYTSSTQAFGFYGTGNIGGNTYFIPSLYKISTSEAKTVTLKESYNGGSVEVISSSGSLTNLYFPDIITISITPEEGKMVQSVKVGDKVLEAIKNEDGTYSASFSGEYGGEIDVSFMVETALRDLELIYNSSSVELSSFQDKYNETNIVTGTITAKEGFFIKNILLNEESILDKYNEETGEIKFTMPEGKNSTLTIETDVFLTVSKVDEIENGSISLEGNIVKKGSNVKVTFSAQDQYTLDKILINNVEIDISKLELVSTNNKICTYNIPITEESIISATFKEMEVTSIADIVSSENAKDKYYIVIGTIGDNSYSTIRVYEDTKYITLNSTLSTQIKNLGLGQGDKVKVYGYYTNSSNASFNKLLDAVAKPTDIVFAESTIMWNAVGSSYDLYYKKGEGDYTLVQANIIDKSYNFDDTLENGTYTFKVVAHSLNGSFEDLSSEITWNYGATYSVAYNINGHGAQPENLENQKRLPSVLPILSATGYRFDGWYTKDGTGDDWGEKVTPNAILTDNVNLYAKWIEASSEKEYSLTIEEYKNANVWENGTKYDTLKISGDKLTIKVSGGSNSGKYYDSGKDWRMYQTEKPTITLSSTIGTISKVIFTYNRSNNGVLVYDGKQYQTNEEITINASSMSFTVGNTGTATNGQVKITAIKVYIVPEENATEDENKLYAESYIEQLSNYSIIDKNNVSEVNNLLTTIECYITAYTNNGGNTSDISNYDSYSEMKTKVNSFNNEKSTYKTTASNSINALNSFIDDEELTSSSSLTSGQYLEIKNLYDEAEANAKYYYDNYGEYNELPSLEKLKLASSLITKYDQESSASVTETYTYDNSLKRSNYSYQWNSSYSSRILTSGMFITNTPLVTMNYSAASLQDVATMDCPVVKNGTVTIDTPNSEINSVQVTLKQYNSKSKSITLKYYNGTELINCGSASTFTGGILVINSTSIPKNVSRIVIDLTSNDNQVGVSAISLNLTTKAKDIIRQDYYASIEDTYTGETLWSALKTLTTETHTYQTSYKDCSLLPYLTDADPLRPGYIIDFYSHLSLDGTWDNGNTWNREHVWCQSKAWYGEINNSTVNAGTDLHQLRPLYKSINSSRNNSQYGELTNRDSYLKNYLDTPYGYLNGDASLGTGNGVFEPLDNVKGDVARVLLYMLVRYKEYISSYPLSNNVYTKEGTEESVYKLLVKWNESDPVDDLEINRNNAVYALQGNRNPFIDYPEYASRIWSNAE